MTPNFVPRTEAQQNASRENGSKSPGPITPEGKARSSRNATTHGLYASHTVLANESQALYDNLLRRYREILNPVGQIEYDIVVDMFNARWRLRRIYAMNNAMLDAEMFMLKQSLDDSFTVTTPALRHADAIQSLMATNPKSAEFLERMETRLTRTLERSLNTLIKLQTIRLGHAPTFVFTDEGIEPEETSLNYVEPEVFSWFSIYSKVPIRLTTVPPPPFCPATPPEDLEAA